MQDLTGKQVGRYLFQQAIGEGGMGVVYRALDTHLDSDVAIKVLVPGRETDGVFLKRFQREAQSMARLTHPNLVKVMDYGEQDGMVYLVMPYVAGGTLAKLSRPMPASRAAALLIPVARALGYAHSLGMIHRDVKPSNVLLTESGEPMVTDFGIAGLMDAAETEQITKTGSGVGTPAYMAPEQIKKDYDHRVDVYALGVVLYELVTGQQPFKGDTPLDTLVKHAMEPLPLPREVNPDVAPEVEAVIVKALAKQPAQRYQTMEEFAQALQGMMSGAAQSVPPVMLEQTGAADENATVDDLATPASLGDLRVSRSKQRRAEPRKLKFWMIGAGGIVVLGLIWGVFTRLNRAEAPPIQEIEPTAELASVGPTESLESAPVTVSNIDGMEMVYVPAGDFVMGSETGDADEKPVHTVYLDAYWIDKYEVTNAQYKQCVADGGCVQPSNTTLYKDSNYSYYPVVYVDWNEAKDYCTWVGRRLPSEAEWEKAARGTDERTYPWGEQLSCEYAQYSGCDGSIVEVGSLPKGASPYGAMDMAGNVREWTEDRYDGNYYSVSPSENPTGPLFGAGWVLRGGSWLNDVWNVRSTNRVMLFSDSRYNDGGFRCAASP